MVGVAPITKVEVGSAELCDPTSVLVWRSSPFAKVLKVLPAVLWHIAVSRWLNGDCTALLALTCDAFRTDPSDPACTNVSSRKNPARRESTASVNPREAAFAGVTAVVTIMWRLSVVGEVSALRQTA